MDGLWLRKAEAGRGVRWPDTVIHRVAQERNSALSLHILRGVYTGYQSDISFTFFSCDFFFCILPAELRRDRAQEPPSRVWHTTLSARACFSHSTAGSHIWCYCLWTEPPRSVQGGIRSRQIDLKKRENPCLQRILSGACSSPPGCPSSFLQSDPLPSGWKNSLCILCWSCCHHIPAQPCCPNTSSRRPVKKTISSHSNLILYNHFKHHKHLPCMQVKPFIHICFILQKKLKNLQLSFAVFLPHPPQDK